MILHILFWVGTAMAGDKEMDQIIKTLQACAGAKGYPGIKACSATAARDAMALVDVKTKAFEVGLNGMVAKDARFGRAGQALREAQQNWRPFVEAHCRFRLEFNAIGTDDFEWRMNDCRLTQAKARMDELGNSFMK